MIRSILAILLGVIAGDLFEDLLLFAGFAVIPVAQVSLRNPSPYAQAVLLLSWSVGPLVAAWIACRITRRAFAAHAVAIALLFCLLHWVVVRELSGHWWLWLGGLVEPPFAALLGAWLARPKLERPGQLPQPYDMRKKNMVC